MLPLSSLSELPGIDIYDGLNKISNSIDSYQRILYSFSLTCDDYQQNLHKALLAGDLQQFQHYVHKLFGISANLGANELAICCENFLENTPSSFEHYPNTLGMEILNQLDKVAQGLSNFRSDYIDDVGKHG